jgi:hypothetical protein
MANTALTPPNDTGQSALIGQLKPVFIYAEPSYRPFGVSIIATSVNSNVGATEGQLFPIGNR